MPIERFDLDVSKETTAGIKAVPTEAEIVRALEEWEEGAAYRKVRHAANVGGCYSTATICLAHETLENQKLTDDLVLNRLRHAEFSKGELNPLELGEPSVAEHVSVPVLNRLLKGMRGTFTYDEAHHFTTYHIEECDYETLRLIADHTSFTKAERQEYFEVADWMANPEFAPRASRAASPKASTAAPRRPRKGKVLKRALLAVAGVMVAVVAFAVFGALALAGAAVAVIVLVALGASGQSSGQAERHPDVRSDYNRRVWAAEHNYEADGDDSHNYEADGDWPW